MLFALTFGHAMRHHFRQSYLPGFMLQNSSSVMPSWHAKQGAVIAWQHAFAGGQPSGEQP